MALPFDGSPPIEAAKRLLAERAIGASVRRTRFSRIAARNMRRGSSTAKRRSGASPPISAST